jgi:putative ABC transport system substrate-binding protein
LGPLASAAETLGIRIESMPIRSGDDMEEAFRVAARAQIDGLLVQPNPILGLKYRESAFLALKHRLPSVSIFRNAAEDGLLLSYGTSQVAMTRRAAYYVDRVLRGASPATLPIEQPREFDLVVNATTAQALGLTIPPTVMLQATEIVS